MSYATTAVDLILCRCGQCDVRFGMTSDMHAARKSDGDTFYCPNGHPRAYGETTETKLRKDLEREKLLKASLERDVERHREARKDAERTASAAKGQVTKIKNRIGKGICPCCNRYFRELHRHLQDKHPDFKTTQV